MLQRHQAPRGRAGLLEASPSRASGPSPNSRIFKGTGFQSLHLLSQRTFPIALHQKNLEEIRPHQMPGVGHSGARGQQGPVCTPTRPRLWARLPVWASDNQGCPVGVALVLQEAKSHCDCPAEASWAGGSQQARNLTGTRMEGSERSPEACLESRGGQTCLPSEHTGERGLGGQSLVPGRAPSLYHLGGQRDFCPKSPGPAPNPLWFSPGSGLGAHNVGQQAVPVPLSDLQTDGHVLMASLPSPCVTCATHPAHSGGTEDLSMEKAPGPQHGAVRHSLPEALCAGPGLALSCTAEVTVSTGRLVCSGPNNPGAHVRGTPSSLYMGTGNCAQGKMLFSSASSPHTSHHHVIARGVCINLKSQKQSERDLVGNRGDRGIAQATLCPTPAMKQVMPCPHLRCGQGLGLTYRQVQDVRAGQVGRLLLHQLKHRQGTSEQRQLSKDTAVRRSPPGAQPSTPTREHHHKRGKMLTSKQRQPPC